MFVLSGDFALNFSPVCDEELGQAGDVFRKVADSHPIFHYRDTVFIAKLSSIGIRLHCQLFANNQIPVDSVDMTALNTTWGIEFCKRYVKFWQQGIASNSRVY